MDLKTAGLVDQGELIFFHLAELLSVPETSTELAQCFKLDPFASKEFSMFSKTKVWD